MLLEVLDESKHAWEGLYFGEGLLQPGRGLAQDLLDRQRNARQFNQHSSRIVGRSAHELTLDLDHVARIG